MREGVAAGGLLTIFQKCSHLGCRVPFCTTSGWFECACHAAMFNGAGEWMIGPAPAGLWHFPIRLEGNEVVVDTSRPVVQMPRGMNTLGARDADRHCMPLP